MKLDFTMNNMVTIVNDVIKSLKPLMHEKGISVPIEYGHDAMLLEFNVARIGQVLLNILSNAIKATPLNEVIVATISENIEPDDALQFIRVSVADSGPGIPQDMIGVMFNKFTKGDAGGNILSSAGLGLAICKEVVERHGGALVTFEIPVKHVAN